jgi:hypothetical protein
MSTVARGACLPGSLSLSCVLNTCLYPLLEIPVCTLWLVHQWLEYLSLSSAWNSCLHHAADMLVAGISLSILARNTSLPLYPVASMPVVYLYLSSAWNTCLHPTASMLVVGISVSISAWNTCLYPTAGMPVVGIHVLCLKYLSLPCGWYTCLYSVNGILVSTLWPGCLYLPCVWNSCLFPLVRMISQASALLTD